MGRTVLIVDDEKVLRDMLEFVLLTEGHTVFTAIHGRDALRVLEHIVPDVILLDLAMPVMDGRAFLREYRAGGRVTAPVILCSAGADEVAAQELQAAGYLHKPFGIPELLAALGAIGKPRGRAGQPVHVAPRGAHAADADGLAPAPSTGVGPGSPGNGTAAGDGVVEPPKRPTLTRTVSASVECRGCRKTVPTHLAYSLRGHTGFRCKSCHDLLVEGIARGRSKSLVRERRRTRT